MSYRTKRRHKRVEAQRPVPVHIIDSDDSIESDCDAKKKTVVSAVNAYIQEFDVEDPSEFSCSESSFK